MAAPAATAAAANAAATSPSSSSSSAPLDTTAATTPTTAPTNGASSSAALRHLACGFLAGTANVAVGYPLDTVKVRLQADKGGGAFGGSILRAGRAVVRAGGVGALYRGMTSPLIGGAAETAVNYAVYGTALERIERAAAAARAASSGAEAAAAAAAGAGAAGGGAASLLPAPPPLPAAAGAAALPAPQQQPSLAAVAAAAAVAGVALSVVLAPVELVKCRLQMSQYPTPAACVRDVVSRHGLRGMMRGLGATVAREAPGNAVFFVAYEGARRGWAAANCGGGKGGGDDGGGGGSSVAQQARRGGATGGQEEGSGRGETASAAAAEERAAWSDALRNVGRATVCGAFAGTTMWLAILPIDVAKTRIQAAHPGSAWDRPLRWHLRALWREGGLGALWAGARATVVRAVPANAAQWAVWEAAMRWLDDGGGGGKPGGGGAGEGGGMAATAH